MIDQGVPNAQNYTVFADSEQTYSAFLVFTEIRGNNNKFYNIQVLTSGSGFHLWTRYGRVGTPGTKSFQTMPQAFCIKEFNKVKK